MHTTIVISNAGQLRSGTTFTAITSRAIATPIFSIYQNRKPTAAATGARVPRDIPRASKALGRTTEAAPYNADQATLSCREKIKNAA